MKKVDSRTKINLSFENSILHFCSPDQLNIINSHSILRMYKENELLFNEGDTSRIFYYINSGKIKLYKNTTDNRQMILNILKEGDFIGHTFLTDKFHTVCAAALEDSDVYHIPIDIISKILDYNKDFQEKYYETIIKNLKGLFLLSHQLAYKPILGRLAISLIRLEEIYKISPDDKDNIIKLKRIDLARFIGTTRETVIRKLKTLKVEQIIDITNEGIKITNREKLFFIARLYD